MGAKSGKLGSSLSQRKQTFTLPGCKTYEIGVQISVTESQRLTDINKRYSPHPHFQWLGTKNLANTDFRKDKLNSSRYQIIWPTCIERSSYLNVGLSYD